MKLISWNVNGIRACLQKGFEDAFRTLNADFFCLQETKAQPHQVELDLPGYRQYWNSAEKKGYSGTADLYPARAARRDLRRRRGGARPRGAAHHAGISRTALSQRATRPTRRTD